VEFFYLFFIQKNEHHKNIGNNGNLWNFILYWLIPIHESYGNSGNTQNKENFSNVTYLFSP
jgi:hypothetical protein